jgi:YHS domain-containing protein
MTTSLSLKAFPSAWRTKALTRLIRITDWSVSFFLPGSWQGINTHIRLGMLMPVDPVCGIEMDQELAVSHDHQGKTYYFCCEGCKRIFVKKPGKYSK